MSEPVSVTVVKVGGSNLDRPAYVDRLCDHIGRLVAGGSRVVVVHGGGPQITSLHEELGEPSTTWEGLRVTSERGMMLTTMALCGLVNKTLVAALVARGIRALGLSGIDLGLLRADLLDERKLGRVGAPPDVDAEPILRLLLGGITLVVAPVSLAPDGRAVNVNADTAARSIATALRADHLDFVTDVPGVKTSRAARATIPRLRVAEAADLLDAPAAVVDGMRPKLRSAIAAVRAGVGRVRVGSLVSMDRGESTEIVA